jgi:hypothetical protein
MIFPRLELRHSGGVLIALGGDSGGSSGGGWGGNSDPFGGLTGGSTADSIGGWGSSSSGQTGQAGSSNNSGGGFNQSGFNSGLFGSLGPANQAAINAGQASSGNHSVSGGPGSQGSDNSPSTPSALASNTSRHSVTNSNVLGDRAFATPTSSLAPESMFGDKIGALSSPATPSMNSSPAYSGAQVNTAMDASRSTGYGAMGGAGSMAAGLIGSVLGGPVGGMAASTAANTAQAAHAARNDFASMIGSKPATSFGQDMASFAPSAIGSTLGGSFGSTLGAGLGSMLGPIGSSVGSIGGGLLGQQLGMQIGMGKGTPGTSAPSQGGGSGDNTSQGNMFSQIATGQIPASSVSTGYQSSFGGYGSHLNNFSSKAIKAFG